MLLKILDTRFNNDQLWLIAIFISLGLIAITLFLKEKYLYSIFILFIGGLIFRLFVAHLDPYLNLWDEQYHALVAKNMLGDPFTPMLYKTPILDYDYTNWTANHIWLHKQPLFLWIIAISFKVFGINEFALRFPSVIMFSLMILFIYRIGSLLADKKTGWLAAFLYTFSGFFIEFVSGRLHTDHNDIAFIFFVTASIWSFLEYKKSNKKYWIVIIGIFAGAAVLTKWLTGLLVYSGWLALILYKKEERLSQKRYGELFLSLCISLLVALPWQIHIFNSFPKESSYELSQNANHFFESVEGHTGDIPYHFSQVLIQYGSIFLAFVIIGLIFLFNDASKKELVVFSIACIGIVFIFFTLAQTKMPMFTSVTCSFLFVAAGLSLKKLLDYSQRYGRFSPFLNNFLLLIVVGIYMLDISNTIERKHTDGYTDNPYRQVRMHNTEIDKKLKDILPSEDYVIFNCDPLNAVLIMFYTDVIAAYGNYADRSGYDLLKKKGIKMAVFVDDKLPSYFADDAEVIKIKEKIIAMPE